MIIYFHIMKNAKFLTRMLAKFDTTYSQSFSQVQFNFHERAILGKDNIDMAFS